MRRSLSQINYCSIFIILLTVAILQIDVWTPLGFGVWELYAIPLWLAFRMRRSPPGLIWVVAAMGSFFSLGEIIISRPGGILLYAWFNRGLWTFILFVAAVVLNNAQRMKPPSGEAKNGCGRAKNVTGYSRKLSHR